jgi:small subunit ribosomal protein S20
MPITKSAQKALRQSKRRRIINLKRSSAKKDLIKKFSVLIEAKKIDEAKKILPQVYQAIDKAAKRGVIKKNTASRKKSRLAKILAKTK